ncbi:hypothetical protein E6C60_3971 [Paenibacillus algicola]|uniref:Copper chaperone NosL n=1 Tax=Paenibacillus algicola TaxID=2565926 RepID=A0A4P8XP98_9BACL|nr:nitrous oxide reductase accessory protein NosL [Paenibacillus algicola]QCT04676.1 hypothetical protein E6C60_3971 [Paenibacillus algicola]
MRKITWIVFASLLLLLSAGCGREEYAAVPIDEQVDKCPVCNMQVKDNAYAVQLQLKDYRTLKFDDLGDLYVWKQEHGTEDIGAQFVRDYFTLEWLHLKDAFYVYDDGIRTPMAFGMVSFKDEPSAERFMQEYGGGTLLTAAQLEEHEWKSHMDMMEDMHGSQQHQGEEKHGDGQAEQGGGHE